MAGRKREVILDQDEDIVSYEHHIASRFVRVQVGVGSISDGEFFVAESQNYENFIIQGEAYDQLMAGTETKPKGVFRRDDLWPFVDIGRQNVLVEREEIKNKMSEALKNHAEPANPEK